MLMDSTSTFSEIKQTFPDAELLQVGGTTCECYRVRLYGKLHFLKRLKPELRTHPQYVAALQKEFEMGYSLDHPYLVRYAARTDDGILMDYVDGETLSQFVEHHPDYFNNRKNADRFLHQLLSVVGYLHSHQVIHLDLKPGNILITRIGHDVKLVDLGYCYADCYSDTTGRTDKYAAPEQMDGSVKVDARTDIYAIGRILQALPCAHFYNKVIKRCTAKEMDLRYRSVDELQQALRRRRSLWWFVLILLLAFVAFAVFLHNRQTRLEPVVAEETILTSQPRQDSLMVKDSQKISSLEAADHSSDILVPPVTQSDTSRLTSPPVAQIEVLEPYVPSDNAEPVLKEDTMALRRELQQLIGLRFRKTIGHYSDSIYSHVNQQLYSQEWIDFEESLLPLYGQVWKEFQDKVSEHTMASEWCQTIMYYRLTQFWQMMRNDPDHDPFYDGKVFHYYDVPC